MPTIGSNVDFRSRGGRHTTVFGVRPNTSPAGKRIREMLQKAITSLPDIYREVFLLRDVEELNNVETAAALCITVGNVKVRLHRARA